MSSDTTDGNQQDLPWNDSPADSEGFAGATEPSPAEVVGGEDDEEAVDVAAPRYSDPYQRDTLDERLAEEMPDRPSNGDDPGVELVAAEGGGLDSEVGDHDDDDTDRDSGLSAEESAVHVRDAP